MYLLHEATKWYHENNYLEIYHPIEDTIIKIECESIEKLWNIIISSKDFKEIITKIHAQGIQSIYDKVMVSKLLKKFEEKNYIKVEEEK